MSILSDFLNLIDPILDGRAYRSVAPDSAKAPYATFFRVSAVPGTTLDRNGGADNESNTRIQVDIYGSALGVDEKAKAIKAALLEWSIDNVILLERDGYEQEVKLHRVTLDISTWHQ